MFATATTKTNVLTGAQSNTHSLPVVWSAAYQSLMGFQEKKKEIDMAKTREKMLK
jgi:hypothetical protein